MHKIEKLYWNDKRKWVRKKIIIAVGSLFDEDSDNFIGETEFIGDDGSAFMHAMLNLAPAYFYKKTVDPEADLLDVNYEANRLIHQFSKIKESWTTKSKYLTPH